MSKKWVLVAACFTLTFAGGPFFVIGVFFTSFEADFGGSRALISSLHAVFLVTSAISGIVMGWFTDRYGAKIPLIACALLIGLGLALCSQAQNIGQLIAFYAIASAGSGATFVVPTSTVLRYSRLKSGIALGITTAGVPVSRTIFTPVAGVLIAEFGWRTSYVFLAVVAWVLISIAAILIPSVQQKKLPGTSQHDAEPESAAPGVTASRRGTEAIAQRSFRSLLTTRAFLLTACLFAFPAVSNHIILVHIVPFAEDTGIAKIAAAFAAGLIGAFGIAGNIIWPSFAGRISWSRLVTVAAVGASLATLWLMATGSLWMLYLFVGVYGLCYTGTVPTRLALMRQVFGTEFMASTTGVFMAVGCVFGALGPILAGFIYDNAGNYGMAFLVGAVCWALMALVAIPLKRSSI
ncbi:MFS transporter [Chloroflexota bacterium]